MVQMKTTLEHGLTNAECGWHTHGGFITLCSVLLCMCKDFHNKLVHTHIETQAETKRKAQRY
jgi:hypothetical protein